MRTFRWVLFKQANLLSTFTFTIEHSIRGNNRSILSSYRCTADSNTDFQHFPFFLTNSYTLNPSILFIKMPQIKYFNVKQINNSENTSCNVWLKPCPFNATVLNFSHTSNKWSSALWKSFIILYFEIFFLFSQGDSIWHFMHTDSSFETICMKCQIMFYGKNIC